MPPPPAKIAFQWDAFISYRHQEPVRTWVRKMLVPALKTAGVRVFIDYQNFRLGEPILKEMARGVEQCRYTLAVLSPDYLESGFAELEPIMAEHLGLEMKERRLILALREPCRPRIDLRARLWLDMSSDGEFAENVARLAAELLESESTAS
jgi:hypothetical protein